MVGYNYATFFPAYVNDHEFVENLPSSKHFIQDRTSLYFDISQKATEKTYLSHQQRGMNGVWFNPLFLGDYKFYSRPRKSGADPENLQGN